MLGLPIGKHYFYQSKTSPKLSRKSKVESKIMKLTFDFMDFWLSLLFQRSADFPFLLAFLDDLSLVYLGSAAGQSDFHLD